MSDAAAQAVTAPAVTARRDRLVVWACVWLTVLQALPYAAVGWITGGGATAGDGILHAVSPEALLGVVAFGVALAVALTRPGLRPVVRPGDPRAMPPMAGPRGGVVGSDDDVGPILRTRPAASPLARLRWAATAALAHAAVFSAAVLLDGAARSGASAVGDSLDDGSALWAFAAIVVRLLVLDVRGPGALLVALLVLTRARRPVSAAQRFPGRSRPDLQPRPGGRTTRWCRVRPPI